MAVFVTAALSLNGSIGAQDRKPAAHSVLSGHVTCADTNAPARLAKVTLHSLHESEDPNSEPIKGATTALDGNFSIPDVAPGRYLVVVELPGYISGVSGRDVSTREHMKDAARQPPEGSTVVEIANGLPASVEMRLERGASVSGVLRYDDGSPAIGILVGLERKNKKGEWEPALQSIEQNFSFFPDPHDGSRATDSAGHYHIDGVPGGSYILHAHLASETVIVDPINDTAHVSENAGVQLDVYNGDVFWKKDAKPFDLSAGDDTNVDMVIPLAKLHTVEGNVTAARDGHGVNRGSVTLLPQDEADERRTTLIEDDGRFRFLYVPEGNYVLKTEDAADGAKPPGPRPHEFMDVVILPDHMYGRAEAALHVGESAASVSLSVPEREAHPLQ